MWFIKTLDFFVLVLALPIFIIGGYPLLGYVAGAVAWTVQRVLSAVLDGMADKATETQRIVALKAGGAIGRAWLVAFTILLVGINNRDVGLAATILVVVVFTTYFAVNLITRPMSAGSE